MQLLLLSRIERLMGVFITFAKARTGKSKSLVSPLDTTKMPYSNVFVVRWKRLPFSDWWMFRFGMNIIRNTAIVNQEPAPVMALLDYFDATYVNGIGNQGAMFPPVKWNVHTLVFAAKQITFAKDRTTGSKLCAKTTDHTHGNC